MRCRGESAYRDADRARDSDAGQEWDDLCPPEQTEDSGQGMRSVDGIERVDANVEQHELGDETLTLRRKCHQFLQSQGGIRHPDHEDAQHEHGDTRE